LPAFHAEKFGLKLEVGSERLAGNVITYFGENQQQHLKAAKIKGIF
jgi:hypothetical protein